MCSIIFEKIVLLRKWAHSQWKAGPSFYYPPWDAVEILDLARQHHNYGFCAQYGIVFLQACQSLGLHARYVDLPGHFVVGVWSDDYNKWVIMDPYNDIHFEQDGIPMKGRDICTAYWKNVKNIYKVDSSYKKTKADSHRLMENGFIKNKIVLISYAGIIQIRLQGCNLSPALKRRP